MLLEIFREKGSYEACALSMGISVHGFRKMWWSVVGAKPITIEERDPLPTDITSELDLEHVDNCYTVGCVSDTHLCGVNQQPTALQAFYKLCEERGITTVFMAGDLIEGTGSYRGTPFQTFINDKDAIIEYVADTYPCVTGITTVGILGNHDMSVYKKHGIDIGRHVNNHRPDLTFYGHRNANFQIGENRITLHHGPGVASSIRTYQSDIAILGHYHTYKKTDNFHDACLIQLGAFHAMSPDITGVILTFAQGEQPGVELIRYQKLIDDY